MISQVASWFDALPVGVFVLDAKGSCIFANERWCSLLGMSASKALGKGWLAAISPEDRKAKLRSWKKIAVAEKQFAAQLRLNRGGKWISVDVATLLDERGEISRYVGVVRDVSTQVQMSSDLLSKERLLEEIVEQLPMMLSLKDAATLKFVRFNRASEELLEFERAEVLGKTSYDLYPKAHADVLTRGDREALKHRGPVRDLEEKVRTKQGRTRVLLTRKVPLCDADGIPQFLLAIGTDITEQKRAERVLRESEMHFRMLADASPSFVWMTGVDGGYSYFNKSWLRFVGRSLNDEIGDGWTKGVHPEDQARWRDVYTTAFSKREPFSVEYRLRRHDGVYRWVVDNGSPVYDFEHTFMGYIGSCLDISTMKEAELAQAQAKANAEETSKLKSRFVANVSHELRTPMHAIMGMTDLVLDTDLTEQQRDYLKTVRSSADYLLMLVNDILDFSKMEAGRLDIITAPANLREEAESVQKLLEARADEKHLALIVTVDPAIPERLELDVLRLRQILVNLLSNSLKFTASGGVALQVRLQRIEDHYAFVAFSVTDSGIGLSEQQKSRLMTPFQQAEKNHERLYGGTGLGLSISAELVKLMGSQLDIESRPGLGSAFSFVLRLKCVQGEAVKGAAAIHESKPAAQQRRLKVLVAEDNLVNQKLIRALLDKAGHEVTLAKDGQEAIDSYASSKFDVIFMDLQMPNVDGIEATHAIRKAESSAGGRIPIVALTANAMTGDKERCLEAGMDYYMSKPFKREELFAILAKI